MNIEPIMLIYMFVFLVLSLVIFSGIFIFFRKREGITWKPVLVGALIWFVFTQVLESGLHMLIFTFTPIMNNPWLFATYGALAAGIFEEVGRYIGFKTLLKKNREWNDGVAFGIGHGGMEMLFIVITVVLQYFIATSLLSQGQVIPPQVVQSLNEINASPFSVFSMIILERILVLPLQIMLSLMVLYAIRTKDITYLLYAILIHVAIDFIPALYQARVLPLVIPMTMMFFVGPIAAYMIFQSKKWFDRK